MKRLAATGLCALFLSCTVHQTPGSSSETPPPAPPPAPVEPPATPEPAEPEAAPPAEPAPVEPAAATAKMGEFALGADCPNDVKEPARIYCDESGKIAGIRLMLNAGGDVLPPRGAEVLSKQDASGQKGRTLVVGSEKDWIWARLVSCGTCRRQLGFDFLLEPARMKDADLLSVQKELGLNSTAALKTPAAWRDAYTPRGAKTEPKRGL